MSTAWTSHPELPRRIAAAIVLSGKKTTELAPELNISARTLERVISGERLAREWEVHRLAEILEVPLWFFREGWAGAARPTDDDRLSELERTIDRLDRKLQGLDVGDRLAVVERMLERVLEQV